MELTKPQKYLSVTIVIVLIAAVAAGAWYLGQGNEDLGKDNDDKDAKHTKDAIGTANKFIDNYTGSFGPFVLDPTNSTADHAVVFKENDSPRLKYSKINFTTTSDAKERFEEIKSKVESKEGFMGGVPTEIQGIAGFEKICAYKMDIRVGTTTQFTVIYFVAYTDEVLVESLANFLYHPDSLATEGEIDEIFGTVLNSIAPGSYQEPEKDALKIANKFIDSYAGSFGPFVLDPTNSTADHAVVFKENGSPQLKYSKINFTTTSDAKERFEEIKLKIGSMGGVMGATPVEITGITGFDDICAYKLDVQKGSTQFTLVYFVAYTDGVLIESSADRLYHPDSLAMEGEIDEIFEAVANSVTAG